MSAVKKTKTKKKGPTVNQESLQSQEFLQVLIKWHNNNKCYHLKYCSSFTTAKEI